LTDAIVRDDRSASDMRRFGARLDEISMEQRW
jgi:hypothetical protein